MIRLKNKSSSDKKNQMTKNKTLKDLIREKISKFDFDFFQIEHQPTIIFFFFLTLERPHTNLTKTNHQAQTQINLR
jgi:hypothetical protein